ncbi:hypothetical protein MMC14_002347, partial [Varicellaria rhodocarpa]|nr:hypothetical protein [Varicellaria rhodocarpa]
SHSAEDAVLLEALLRCHMRIAKLEQLVKKMESGFASKSSAVRRWTAFKKVLDKDKIEEFRGSMRDTKIDLLLLNQAIAE